MTRRGNAYDAISTTLQSGLRESTLPAHTNLIIAALAVGGYSLERAWSLLPILETEGLTDPALVLGLDEGQVVQRLARSGYDRGPIVTLSMARRLISIHHAARDGVVEQASELIREGRVRDAEGMLRGVKGVGPIVFKYFMVLETSA